MESNYLIVLWGYCYPRYFFHNFYKQSLSNIYFGLYDPYFGVICGEDKRKISLLRIRSKVPKRDLGSHTSPIRSYRTKNHWSRFPRSYTRNKMLATGTEKTNQTIGGAQAQRAPLPAGLESIWQTTNQRRRDHSSASSTAGLPPAHGAEPGRDGWITEHGLHDHCQIYVRDELRISYLGPKQCKRVIRSTYKSDGRRGLQYWQHQKSSYKDKSDPLRESIDNDKNRIFASLIMRKVKEKIQAYVSPWLSRKRQRKI